MQQLRVENGGVRARVSRRAEVLTGPLWHARRVTREERHVLEEIAVDASFLDQCAENATAVVVNDCPPTDAAELICDATAFVSTGLVWAIASGEIAYSALRKAAKNRLEDKRWAQPHQMYDAHPLFANAESWTSAGVRMLATTASSLRATMPKNPRKRQDVLKHSVSLVAIIDPELSLCSRWRRFEYSWVIRDVVSRISASHGPTPLIVLTARPALSMNTKLVRTSFGVDGLIYLQIG